MNPSLTKVQGGRRRWGCLLRAAVLAWILTGAAASARGQDMEQARVATESLGENVFVLSGAGGNLLAYTGGGGILLIDSGYAELYEKVRSALADLSEAPVRYVVNTHWHFDHVGGNEAFARHGAVVVAHENTRRRMAAGQLISMIDRQVPPSPQAALPEVCLSDSLMIHFQGEDVTLLHPRNAHSDGDVVVCLAGANVVHTGDVWFNGGYPFIDLSSGGTIDGVIGAVEMILARCDENTRIVPGHGPVSDRRGLEEYAGMLRRARELVAAGMARGDDPAALQGSAPLAELDGRWDGRMFPSSAFVEMIYRSLTAR